MNPAALLKNKMVQRVLLLLAILVILFLFYKFFGKIKNDIVDSKIKKQHKKDLNNLLSEHTSDPGGIVTSNVKTYDQAQYNLMADGLYRAMDGLGTDEDTIYAILSRLRTEADWYELVSAFGNKKSSFPFSSFEDSLQGWLSDELGGSDKTKINTLLGKFNVQI